MVKPNGHVTDLAYANDIVLLSNRQRMMQGLLEVVKSHAATVNICINVSKTKAMSTHVPGVQLHAVLLDDEPLQNVDKFKYFGSLLIENDQGTREISVNLSRCASSR